MDRQRGLALKPWQAGAAQGLAPSAVVSQELDRDVAGQGFHRIEARVKLAVEDVCALPRTVDELPVGAVKSRSKAALQMAAPACGLDFESLGRVPDRVSALVDDVAASRGPALAPGGVVRKPRKQRGRARH